MAKEKERSLINTVEAQKIVEENHSSRFTDDKFASAEKILKPVAEKDPIPKTSPVGRINPQLCCTIEPDDAEILKDIRLHLINKFKDPKITQSMVMRKIIRLANNNRDSL